LQILIWKLDNFCCIRASCLPRHQKKYVPLFLIPIGFGIVPAIFPLAAMSSNVAGVIGSVVAAGVFSNLLR